MTLSELIHAAMTNPIFAGVAGGTLMTGALGFVLFQLRALPGRVVSLIKSQFTVTLTIYSDGSAFQNLSLWLSRHPDAQKSRRLTVAQWWSRTMDKTEFALTPGPGRHLIRHAGHWFLVARESSGPNNNGANSAPAPTGGQRQETLVFTTLGRSQEPIKAMLLDAAGVEEDGDTLPIHLHGIGQIGRRAKRPLETVYLDAALKRQLIDDIELFTSRRTWYAQRGIPWRRGYLLSGPPGTGKSSLIFAVASRLNRPVHIVNPATINNDAALQYALNSNSGAIVVLEDIDSIEILKARPNMALVRQQAEMRARGGEGAQDSCSTVPAPTLHVGVAGGGGGSGRAGEGLTLSGFLNAIDGVGAHEGRILFVTSNMPDALDPALMRPGRVDRKYFLGLAMMEQAMEMFGAFFPGVDGSSFAHAISPRLPMAAAELQDIMLAMTEGECPVLALQAELARRIA